MRFLLALLWSMSAGAATFEGTVVHEGKPVAEANVRLFVRSEEAVLGCPAFPEGAILGPCTCPAGVEALTARLLKGEGGAQPIRTATTDAAGKFRVALPEGQVVLVATITSKDGELAGQAELRATKQVFAVGRTIALQADVSESAKGAIVYRLNKRTRELARVDDLKTVRVPPGGQMLIVVAPGMLPGLAWARDASSPISAQFIVGDPHKTKIALNTPSTMKAVVSHDGKIVVGAEYVLDPEGCAISGRTDEKGEITVPSKLGLAGRVIEVTSGELGARPYFHDRKPIAITLKKAGRLEVSFVDAKGAPAPKVEAYLNFEAHDLIPRTADAKGRWVQGALPLIDMKLRVLPPWVLIDDGNVSLTGVVKKQLTVQRGVTISGRVLDSTGTPMSGLTITPSFGDELSKTMSVEANDHLRWARRAWTDMSGEFEIGGLLPGSYNLRAHRGDTVSGTATVTAPGRVEIKKAAPYVLTGAVFDQAGAPVVGMTVTLRASGAEDGPASTALTDAHGGYRVEVPTAGSYEVMLWRRTPGEVPVRKTVEIGAKNAPIRFEVPTMASIRGTVVDESGAPIEGAMIDAVPVDALSLRLALFQKKKITRADALLAKANNELGQAVTSADGKFSLVTGFESFVFVTAKGFQTKELRVGPGEPLTVTLVR